MNTIKKFAIALAVLGLLPLAALAHDNNTQTGSVKIFANTEERAELNNKANLANKIINSWPWRFHKSVTGKVTAINSTGFNMTAKNNKTFTVNTPSTTILTVYGTTIGLSGIKIDDNVMVLGTQNASTINASLVVVTPANTHPAKTNGTVTAVSGSTITVQSTHDGVIYPVTINTNASTTVISGGNATTTAAITVGSKISVKGLWDELLNVLNAIKIRIK